MRSIKNLNEKKKALAVLIKQHCRENNISVQELYGRVKQDLKIIEQIFAGNVENVELSVLENISAELEIN